MDSDYRKFRKILNTASKVFFTVILACLMAVFILHQNKRIQFQHKIDRLNMLMPVTFEPLIQVARGHQIDVSDIAGFIRFYEKVHKYFPDNAETFGMLGFCYYHMDRGEEALAFYNQARFLKPEFFWFHYNSGLLYYQKKEYSRARQSLKQAVDASLKESLDFIMSSGVIYKSVLLDDPQLAKETKRRMKHGFQSAYTLLVMSHYFLKDYSAMYETAIRATNNGFDRQGDFLYYAGWSKFLQKQYIQAIYFLQRCVDKNKNHLEAHRIWALCLQALGKEDIAKKYLKKAQEIEENQGSILLPLKVLPLQLL